MAIGADDPFASPQDMADRSQGQITEATHPFLAKELLAATTDIRDFCRWHVSPEQQVTYRRASSTPDDVYLPAMRIKNVDAVTIDGEPWDDAALEGVEFDPLTGWTNLCGRVVEVKFTAGYAEVPEPLVAATLELAASALGTALGVSRAQAGGVSVTFERAGGGIVEDSPLARRLLPYQIGRLP